MPLLLLCHPLAQWMPSHTSNYDSWYLVNRIDYEGLKNERIRPRKLGKRGSLLVSTYPGPGFPVARYFSVAIKKRSQPYMTYIRTPEKIFAWIMGCHHKVVHKSKEKREPRYCHAGGINVRMIP